MSGLPEFSFALGTLLPFTSCHCILSSLSTAVVVCKVYTICIYTVYMYSRYHSLRHS